ncbi:MAG: group III truncated hemoglobin [Ketobacteraceae bacterium]|nr:group III truncated hemoglobin [Ketobacteraceae bacterium]
MSEMQSRTIKDTQLECDTRPDLDSAKQINRMVRQFYDKLLADELMAPVFLDVAGVDLREHLPTISLYWQKMLLGDSTYRNNTMAKHRAVHRESALTERHFTTWLCYFLETVDAGFAGPYAEKAKKIARNVIKNMKKQLLAA